MATPMLLTKVRGFVVDRRTRMNTDIVARLTCAALLFYPPFSAMTMHTSLSSMAHYFLGYFSYPLFGGMTLLSAMICTDVYLNSWKRVVPQICFLARNRDRLYLMSAFCSVVIPFCVSKVMTVEPAANYLYALLFAISVGLAWCDAIAKKNTVEKKAKREKTY